MEMTTFISFVLGTFNFLGLNLQNEMTRTAAPEVTNELE